MFTGVALVYWALDFQQWKTETRNGPPTSDEMLHWNHFSSSQPVDCTKFVLKFTSYNSTETRYIISLKGQIVAYFQRVSSQRFPVCLFSLKFQTVNLLINQRLTFISIRLNLFICIFFFENFLGVLSSNCSFVLENKPMFFNQLISLNSISIWLHNIQKSLLPTKDIVVKCWFFSSPISTIYKLSNQSQTDMLASF